MATNFDLGGLEGADIPSALLATQLQIGDLEERIRRDISAGRSWTGEFSAVQTQLADFRRRLEHLQSLPQPAQEEASSSHEDEQPLGLWPRHRELLVPGRRPYHDYDPATRSFRRNIDSAPRAPAVAVGALQTGGTFGPHNTVAPGFMPSTQQPYASFSEAIFPAALFDIDSDMAGNPQARRVPGRPEILRAARGRYNVLHSPQPSPPALQGGAAPAGIPRELDFTEDTGSRAAARRTRREDHPVLIRRIQCRICMDSFRADEAIEINCGHVFCKDCLQFMFTTAFKNESLFPPKCCRPIALEEVKQSLTPDICTEYLAKTKEYETLGKNRTYCANRQCNAFVPLEVKQCKCGTQTCTQCKNAQHEGQCPKDENSNLFTELAQEEGWKQCPDCSRMIELRDGCNQMTCMCGKSFCYQCLSEWKTCACAQFTRADGQPGARALPANGEDALFQEMFLGQRMGRVGAEIRIHAARAAREARELALRRLAADDGGREDLAHLRMNRESPNEFYWLDPQAAMDAEAAAGVMRRRAVAAHNDAPRQWAAEGGGLFRRFESRPANVTSQPPVNFQFVHRGPATAPFYGRPPNDPGPVLAPPQAVNAHQPYPYVGSLFGGHRNPYDWGHRWRSQRDSGQNQEAGADVSRRRVPGTAIRPNAQVGETSRHREDLGRHQQDLPEQAQAIALHARQEDLMSESPMERETRRRRQMRLSATDESWRTLEAEARASHLRRQNESRELQPRLEEETAAASGRQALNANFRFIPRDNFLNGSASVTQRPLNPVAPSFNPVRMVNGDVEGFASFQERELRMQQEPVLTRGLWGHSAANGPRGQQGQGPVSSIPLSYTPIQRRGAVSIAQENSLQAAQLDGGGRPGPPSNGCDHNKFKEVLPRSPRYTCVDCYHQRGVQTLGTRRCVCRAVLCEACHDMRDVDRIR